jgi:hypothetical protein
LQISNNYLNVLRENFLGNFLRRKFNYMLQATVYYGKTASTFLRTFLLPLWWQIKYYNYQITRSLIAADRRLQNSPVETANINNDISYILLVLFLLSTPHFKWQSSQPVSQSLWPSYPTHVNGSYFLSR